MKLAGNVYTGGYTYLKNDNYEDDDVYDEDDDEYDGEYEDEEGEYEDEEDEEDENPMRRTILNDYRIFNISEMYKNRNAEEFTFLANVNDPDFQEKKILAECKRDVLHVLCNIKDETIQKHLKNIENKDITIDIRDFTLKAGPKSYTTDKCDIVLCVRDPDNGELYDKKTLMYVLLHELGHVCCKSTGHDEQFNATFDIILETCKKLGIETHDHETMPRRYCGVTE